MRSGTRLRLVGASAFVLAAVMASGAHGQEAEDVSDESGEFLGTITLGESKRAIATDTAVPETTIDREELRDRQATTIAELIDSVPGVSLVNGSTPSGSGINIRGFGANGTFGTDQKVAVFIDGATSGSEELYRIGTQLFTDPYLYQSVRVQRGTVGSLEYGSGIVGGIVLLETIDASNLTGGEPGFKWGQTLGYASNGGGLSSATTLAWQPTEDLEFLANYSYREQDNQDDGDGEAIGNSAFELPSYLLKGRYQFGAGRTQFIEASYSHTESADRDIPYDTFITETDFFGNVDRDTTSETFSLVYGYSPFDNDLVDLEVALTYSNQEFDQTFIEGSTPIADFVRDLANADQQYETTKLTVKNESFVVTGPVEHTLRYGVEFQERERADATAAPGGTDERYAVFLIDDVRLFEGLTFTPALRYESSSIDGLIPDPDAPPAPPFGPPPMISEVPVSYENDALMGAASLRYQFESGFAVFTSYAYTESLPIIDDLENPVFMTQPELANTFEVGFSFDRQSVLADRDAVALKLNYYDTRLDDVTSYSGADQVDLKGVELEASYATAGGFYTDLNATFTEGEELQLSGAVIDWDRTPQDSVRWTLGKRFGEQFDLSSEVLSVAESTLNVGGTSPTQAEDFILLNFRATIRPQSGILEGTQIRLGLENAFNEDYRPLLATRNAPGRNFKVTLSRVFF